MGIFRGIHFRTLRAWVLLVGVASGLSACLSNGKQALKQAVDASSSSPASVSSILPPKNSGGSGNIPGASPVTLTNVIKSAATPATTFDLIFDGKGQIKNLCLDKDGVSAGSGQGPSTCQCKFEYARGSATETFSVEGEYYEADLFRCRYDGLPAGTSSVKVSLYLTLRGISTNALEYKFITDEVAGFGATPDFTDPNLFREVKRFQCRDDVYIPYMLDSGDNTVYDPFQSANTLISYGLNFYTTNPGGSLISFASLSGTDGTLARWDCAMNPVKPPSWQFMNIYSIGADANGSKRIFPTTGSSFDRSTIYFPQVKGGVFTIPVNALIAPKVLSATPPANQVGPLQFDQSLGYAAAPIATSDGEVCPDAPKPAGWEWVKVFAFRASLPSRNYVQITQDMLESGPIACNPGKYKPSSPFYVFEDCRKSTTTDERILDDTLNSKLASRVLWNATACVDFTPSDPNGSAGGSSSDAKYSSFTPGSDLWKRVGGAADVTSSNVFYNLGSKDAPFSKGTSAVPYDQRYYLAEIENDQRSDYLLVAVPPTVMKRAIQNRTSGSDQYIPYTFRSSSLCNADDPDSNETCKNNTAKKTIYDLWRVPISTNPAASGSGTDAFPVCTVRPKS